MLDTTSRRYVQKGFDVFAKGSRLTKLHPNTITIMAFLIGVLCSVALMFGQPLIALTLLWISGAFDVLDGTVARLTQKSSKFGAFLDLVLDRMVEGFVILGFFVYQPQFGIAYCIFFMGAMFNFTTFMLAGSLFKNDGNKSMHYDIGIVERTEAFIAFSAMMLFPSWIFITLNLFNALMIITGIMRMYRIAVFVRKNG